MQAFLFPTPVPLPSPFRTGVTRPVPRCSLHHDDSTLSLDPLSAFDALCWRSQNALCERTAEVDGLGTFSESPSYFAPQQHMQHHRRKAARDTRGPASRVMRGGHSFDHAAVDVVRSAVTHNDRARESVGLTVNLRPRHPLLPTLRAGVHYFQVGGGLAWWFTGSVDVCLQAPMQQLVSPTPSCNDDGIGSTNYFVAHLFTMLSNRFFTVWSALRDDFRAPTGSREATLAFLSGCLHNENGQPFTAVQAPCDRDICFRFASDFVDHLLPVYLPLLAECQDPHPAISTDENPLHLAAAQHLHATPAQPRQDIETFCLTGGATCESSTICASPLGSWRFSLSPSAMTAAGKAYQSLQNNPDDKVPTDLYL